MSLTSKILADQKLSNGGLLANFMPIAQRFALKDALKGEEGDAIADMVLVLGWRVQVTPVTYQTASIAPDDRVLYLHYFKGGVDAWIVERDMGDGSEEPGVGEQLQALGKITMYGDGWQGAEWGYLSIKDLIENGVELDMNWEPKTVKEMK